MQHLLRETYRKDILRGATRVSRVTHDRIKSRSVLLHLYVEFRLYAWRERTKTRMQIHRSIDSQKNNVFRVFRAPLICCTPLSRDRTGDGRFCARQRYAQKVTLPILARIRARRVVGCISCAPTDLSPSFRCDEKEDRAESRRDYRLIAAEAKSRSD